jgi:hypothetical protein
VPAISCFVAAGTAQVRLCPPYIFFEKKNAARSFRAALLPWKYGERLSAHFAFS